MSSCFSSDLSVLDRYYKRRLVDFIVYKNLGNSKSFKQSAEFHARSRITIPVVSKSGDRFPHSQACLAGGLVKQVFFQNVMFSKRLVDGEVNWLFTSLSSRKFKHFPLFFFSFLPNSMTTKFTYLGFDNAYGVRFAIDDIFNFFGSHFFSKFYLDFFGWQSPFVIDFFALYLNSRNFKTYFSIFKIFVRLQIKIY